MLAAAVLALTVGLAWGLNRDTLPPSPATFRAPAPKSSVNRYDVKASDADGLVLASAEGTDIRLPRPTAVDAVVRGGALGVGDWVNVIGIVDEVRNFSIRAILVLPEHGPIGADGVARTPAGFSGLETRRDPAERVIISGQVVRTEGETATLTGPAGEITLNLRPGAQVFRLEKGDPAAIRAGDGLASAEAASDGRRLAHVLVAIESSAGR
ncbi:MAG: hypothetical protein ABIP13_05075 [Tepidiformaceae bacterium]